MKQDLREALPKHRNPPSFTLRKEKNKGGFVKTAPELTVLYFREHHSSMKKCMSLTQWLVSVF